MRPPYQWNALTAHSFYRLLAEIDECLQQRLYLPALCSVLTIPDICGKILYPNAHSKFRYVSWYDEYQAKYDINPHIDGLQALFDSYLDNLKSCYPDTSKGWPKWPDDFTTETDFGLTGQAIYALRCSVLHAGESDNLGYDKRYKFSFTVGPVVVDGLSQYCHLIDVAAKDDVRCYINIEQFCLCSIRNALAFYLERFSDFKDNNVQISSLTNCFFFNIVKRNDNNMLHRICTVFDEDEVTKQHFQKLREVIEDA